MENRINNLILELNSRCNNNCIYCYIPQKNRCEKHDKDAKYFKTILKDFIAKKVRNVDFTGGEPTLYSHLIELIKFSKKIGYVNINLVTNGRLLSYQNYCNKLIDAGVNRFVLSMDGPNREITESITRSPDSYKQLIKAIKNIKDRKIDLGITIVVNKINYKHIPKIIKNALILGADFINIQFLLPYVVDKNVFCRKIPPNIIPSYDDSTKYVKMGLDKYGKKNKINVHFIPICYMIGYEEYLLAEIMKFDRLVVNHNGYEYNMGEHLRRGSIKTVNCKACSYNNICSGFFFSYAKEFGTPKLQAYFNKNTQQKIR